MKILRRISFIMTLVVAVCIVFPVATESDSSFAYEEFSENESMVKANENSSRYDLWINANTADICLIDTVSGASWWSCPQTLNEEVYGVAAEELRSQLLIKYYDSDKVARDINSAKCIDENSVEISYAENGFKTVYNFIDTNEDFSITVLYQLEGDRLKITLPADGIKERGNSRISTVTLMPNLFSGSEDDDGYLLLPESSGAIMRFSDKKPFAESWSGKIYGRDTAVSQLYEYGDEGQVLLPVLGMIRNENGLFCVIESNEAAASIIAVPSGKYTDRANAAVVFTMSQMDTAVIPDHDWKYKEYPITSEKRTEYDCSVSIYPLAEAKNYSDLAAFYREMLDKEFNRKLLSEPFTGTLEIYGQGWKKSSFLGFPIKKNVKATSFKEAAGIVSSMTDGLEGSVAVALNGFGAENYKKKTINKFKPDWLLGGKKGFETLLETASENINIYWAQNIMRQYDTGIFKKKYAINGLNKIPVKGGDYSLATNSKEEEYFWWYLKPERLVFNIEKLTGSFDYACGLSLPYIGETLYSDYSDNSYTERQKSLEIIEKSLKNIKNPTMYSGGNLYAAVYSDVITGVKGNKAVYDCMSESVPFYGMVFYGYTAISGCPINYGSEWEDALLDCLEYGIAPSFQLTYTDNRKLRETTLDELVNTCFENIRTSASEILSKYDSVAKKLFGSHMIYHERQGEISIVKYSGEKTLIINRGEKEVTTELGVISPGGWILAENS